jgi:hypothetical protein
MKRVAHRLAGVVSGALVLGAVALPMASAQATVPQPSATIHSIVHVADSPCEMPDNPIWGDGTCGP